MTAVYLFLANLIAVIHCLTALFLLSLPVAFCIDKVPRKYIYLQVFVLGIAGIFHVTSGICPLTFGENYFRVLGGGTRYEGNFLNHYAETLFHFSIPNVLVSNAIIVLAGLLVVVLFRKYYSRRQQTFKDIPYPYRGKADL